MGHAAFCCLCISLCLGRLCAKRFAIPASTDPAAAHALLTRYCAGCHNDKLKTGGVSLSGIKTTELAEAAPIMERVLRKVRTGEMPPLGLPAPDPAVRASFTNWLEVQLDHASAAKPNPGAPSIHRMNRAEYSNAVRDLLALDIDHKDALPPDDSGYGFDNIGDVLTVSPLHMEKYMSSARKIARLALGTGKTGVAIEKYSAVRGIQDIDDLPLTERGGILIRRYFPLDAEYSILVRVRGAPAPGTPQPKLDLRVDGKRVKLLDVNIDAAETAQDSRNYEVRMPLSAGIRAVGAGFLNEYGKMESAPPAGRRGAPAPPLVPRHGRIRNHRRPLQSHRTRRNRKPQADLCLPPVGGQARRALRQPDPHRARPPCVSPAGDPGGPPAAHEALRRRPQGRRQLRSRHRNLAQGRAGLAGFPVPRGARPGGGGRPAAVHRVSDLELASRLSFFLWSSIPDETLLRLAEQGKLKDPAVLHQQVARMLADPKSKALVDNFAGQWLQLRNVASWRIDPDKFPAFDDSLRDALRKETENFFEYIVREDRSVLDFLDADYTFLNERLAKHYGIPGVHGSYFRQVALTNPERGGILTQGSILTVTSYPTRTSPVIRGKWILENVLGSPPPPPPPDVPAAGREMPSARPRTCASSWKSIAPMPAARAAMRAWTRWASRSRITTRSASSAPATAAATIDASGALPNGQMVRGPGDLKKVMMDRRDQFIETLGERLLTYSLGRGLDYYDQPAVRQIRRNAAKSDYQFSSLILSRGRQRPIPDEEDPGTMMITKKSLARRTFLRGVGATMALPLFDSMTPAFAAPGAQRRCRGHPHGVPLRAQRHHHEGLDSGGRRQRLRVRAHPASRSRRSATTLPVLTGLEHHNGFALGDGAGDHARAGATWLTGVHPKKTQGADIHAGISVDQIAAREIGKQTPLPSLELGLEDVRMVGNCDSGYSCAYSNTLCWSSPTTPLPYETNPRAVFERLFGDGETTDPVARARMAQAGSQHSRFRPRGCRPATA